MDQPNGLDVEDTQHNITDFHADCGDVPGETAHQAQFDSNRTHVTATQPDDMQYLADADTEAIFANLNTQVATQSKPAPVTGIKTITRPDKDTEPIGHGFTFGPNPALKRTTVRNMSSAPQAHAATMQQQLLFVEIERSHAAGHLGPDKHVAESAEAQPPSVELNKSKQDEPQSVRDAGSVNPAQMQYPPSIVQSTAQPADESSKHLILDLSSALRDSALVGGRLQTPGGRQTVTVQYTGAKLDQNDDPQLSRVKRTNSPFNISEKVPEVVSPGEDLVIGDTGYNPTHQPIVDLTGPSQEADKNLQIPFTSSRVASPQRATASPQRPVRGTYLETAGSELPLKASKVTKRKRSKQSIVPERRVEASPSSGATAGTEASDPSQEDILSVLLYKVQQDKTARDTDRARNEARDAELATLSEAHEKLQSRLHVLQERDLSQNAQIQKYSKAHSQLRTKLQKLEGTIANLSNENIQLSEQAKSSKEAIQDLRDEHQAFLDSYKVDRGAIAGYQHRSREILNALKVDNGRLKDRCEIYEQLVNENLKLLESERYRNDTLIGQIEAMVRVQERSQDQASHNLDALIGKVQEMLNTPQGFDSAQLSDILEPLVLKLDEAYQRLGEINDKPVLRAQDLADIHARLQDLLESTASANELSSSNVDAMDKTVKKSIETLLREFATLRANIKTQKELYEALEEAQREKAETEAFLEIEQFKLQNALASKAELDASNARMEDELYDTLAQLQVSRAQPVQDEALLSRIVTLQGQKDKAEREHADLLREQQHQYLAAQTGEKRAKELQLRIDNLQSQLDQSEASCAELRARMQDFDKQVAARVGVERAELIKAVDQEKANAKFRISKPLAEAQGQLVTIAKKHDDLGKELSDLQRVHMRETKRCGELAKELSDCKTQSSKTQEELEKHIEDYRLLQYQQSDQDDIHAEKIQAYEEDLEEETRMREDAEKELNQYIGRSEATKNQTLTIINDRLRTLDPLYPDQSDVLGALIILVRKEEASRAEIQNATTEPLQPSHDGQENNDTAPAVIPAEDRDTQPAEESQELPYGATSANMARNRAGVQEESQELPYTRNSGQRYHSMSALMHDHDQSQQEQESDRQMHNDINNHAVDQQSLQYVVEESQTYHRRISHSTRSAIGMAAPAFARTDPNNGTFVQPTTTSFGQILEATSPVGDTRGLFPPTPTGGAKSPGPHRSIGNGSTSKHKVHTRGHTSGDFDDLNGLTGDTFRTPKRPLQTIDPNRSMASPMVGGTIDGTVLGSLRPRKGYKYATATQGRSDNKFKSKTVIEDSQEGLVEQQTPRTDPRPMLKKQTTESLKRKITATEPSNTSKSRKRWHVETQELGPVIEDSQSPSAVASQRKLSPPARKSTRRKSQDKFQRRFQEQLEG